MKKKIIAVFILLFIIVATVGAIHYYLYIYSNPKVVTERERLETNAAYERLLESIQSETEEYDFRVLINPVYGGSSKGFISGELTESDIALEVAKQVSSLNENKNIRIILTREGNTNPTLEQRLELVEQVNPDIILEICVSEDINTSVMGAAIYYDEVYYDYRMTNDSIADIFEKSIVNRTKTVAKGIFSVGGNEKYSLIYNSKRPAVAISCGYISNVEELAALGSDAYRKNIALGILDGIGETFAEMKK